MDNCSNFDGFNKKQHFVHLNAYRFRCWARLNLDKILQSSFSLTTTSWLPPAYIR